jgi:N-acetylglutamate synthase-like GNAT family acetyltransferase
MTDTSVLQISPIPFHSAEYQDALVLRESILRAPLGLALTEIDTQSDVQDFHFGAFHPDQGLIGCVSLHPVTAETAQLRQMAVHAQAQGQGVGQRLVVHFEQQARQHGYQNIILNARVSAEGFYQRCGYVCNGEIFTIMTVPHIKMQKVL